MANTSIPSMPIATSLDGSELVPIIQPGNASEGVSKRATAQQIANLGVGGRIPLDISSGSLVTGVLAVSHGGIGTSNLTANGVIVGNGTGALAAVALATALYVLTSNGTAAPTFQWAGLASSIVNVQDPTYGAVGNGTTDDTTAIQSAIDAAFGTSVSPHAVTSATSNKMLFFPPGKYLTTRSLKFPPMYGATVMGSGRGTTWINCTATNTATFNSNGIGYSRFEGLRIVSGAGSTGFNLDWDGSSPVSTQSNTFADMLFENGANGVIIGAGGFQASENLFQNCFWASNTTSGITVSNYNALQNTVIGGNFQSCGVGIYTDQGSVSVIASVGFQGSVIEDIVVNNSANDTITVIGCRTESTSFVRVHNGLHAAVIGCNQTSSNTSGFFARMDTCPTTIDACVSIAGRVICDSVTPRVSVRDCSFGRSDWISYSGLTGLASIDVLSTLIGGTPNNGSGTLIAHQLIDSAGVHNYMVSPSTTFAIYSGSGVPSITAATGSWYMRSDGNTTTNRAYINTNGSASWTGIVTVS